MDSRLTIRSADRGDLDPLARHFAALWTDATVEQHAREVDDLLSGRSSSVLPRRVLVAEIDGDVIGFLEVGLRSHADGCDPSRAVGFVEGWFVEERHRGRGVGGALMRSAEAWARLQGCQEMASDTWVDSDGSVQAHLTLGFEVVDRCVNLRKSLR